ncbi:MAG TPA: DUF4197 domain-containing protein [Myxococcota bacterium]|nr:DUF4197 domain-containing protein [Myxococcota bacterium]
MIRTVALALAIVAYSTQLSDATASSGLKDALKVATERAVSATSKDGGFLNDPKIRIPLPGKLEGMATGLRAVGMGSQVDELEVAMNHAAEKAAGEATPVFVDAIQGMSFEDAAGILRGNDTAATTYFKKKTTAPLTAKFRPIVDEAMKNVGVTKLYESLVGQYTSTPFVSAPKLDLNGYVTDKALSGLFTVVGDEEKRIRKDPVARSTDLLKQVFGH